MIAAAVVLVGLMIAASPAFAGPLVVIDAGHGGPYNHARYRWLAEKQANLLFALELGSQLRASGYEVAYTRTWDTAVGQSDIPTWHWVEELGRWVYIADAIYWYPDDTPRDDLQARSDIANNLGADIFISIHCNGSASRRARGTENWAPSDDALGIQLGQYVQNAVLRQTRQRNRGAGQTNFYVTRWANMPALLIETGFMSNPAEGGQIANANWRRKYVRGIVNGLNEWMATDPIRPLHPRYAGAIPSDAAVIASRTGWQTGASTVVLASTLEPWHSYVAPLATARLNAPVLFADAGGLSPATSAEIARLRPSRIIALGTAYGVSDAVIAQAAAAASIETSEVVRVGGASHANTAALLSESLASLDSSMTVIVANPRWITDTMAGNALAASRDNAVLLLTQPDGSLPPEATGFLERNRDIIEATITLGEVSDAVTQGLPNRSRITRGEPYATSAAIVNAARPTGYLWPFVYSPAMPTDAVVATSAAIHTDGGVPMPVHWKVMSPYTREWLENVDTRVFAATVVGDHNAEPLLVDYMLMKAISSR